MVNNVEIDKFALIHLQLKLHFCYYTESKVLKEGTVPVTGISSNVNGTYLLCSLFSRGLWICCNRQHAEGFSTTY